MSAGPLRNARAAARSPVPGRRPRSGYGHPSLFACLSLCVLFVRIVTFFVLVVVSKDSVQVAPRAFEEPLGRAHLVGSAVVGDLDDPAAQPGCLGEQPGDLPCLLLRRGLPGTARHIGVLLDVLPPRAGE